MEKIYTIPQVAEYLQISRSKMYDWVKRGKTPHVKIGRNVRIRESDLQAWIESQITYTSQDGQFVMFNLRD